MPEKLKAADEVRVVAPACSLEIISPENQKIANERFAELDLKLSFGEHVNEKDEFDSSSIESRLADFHAAFADPNVKMVLAVIGGFNSNQLLSYIDWDLIKNNPKIFCGYSDITALGNAIFAKTGLVTYSGPAYASFGEKYHFDYSLEYFKKCLFDNAPIEIIPSREWSSDKWYLDQEKRKVMPNEGFWVINEGTAEGTILGGNSCTFNLLQGTEFMPDLKDSILFLEEDDLSLGQTDLSFDRDLQSLIHQPGFSGMKGMVIGRFQTGAETNRQRIEAIIKSKKELANIPIIANADFGHTEPRFTFPIGGKAKIKATKNGARIEIISH